MDISSAKQEDDGPALIQGADDELGSEFIDMEMDDLNLHPCMVPMVCLLKHMENSGITPPVHMASQSQSLEMPAWMICLYRKFSDPLLSFNIKLFLMRVIVHTHSLFKPYARYWLTPIIQLCNQMFENSADGLNTFIIDTIVILLSWHTHAIPSDLDSLAVQRLIEYLFSNCSHRNPIVMKSNLDLIKKLVECWKERVHAPTLTLYKLISESDLKSKHNAIGLSLIGILLANQILPYYTPPARQAISHRSRRVRCSPVYRTIWRKRNSTIPFWRTWRTPIEISMLLPPKWSACCSTSNVSKGNRTNVSWISWTSCWNGTKVKGFKIPTWPASILFKSITQRSSIKRRRASLFL